MANVDELITAAVEFDRRHPEDGSLEAFLEQVALVADTDAIDGSNDRVTIMTLHAAKGLEYPRVFIIAVEDDLLPHSRSKSTESEFEEERRLLFVGITRAEQWLQLSCCKRRAVRGDIRPVIPSPFLNELPLDEMKRIESAGRRDWFDDDDAVDQSYPDSWDLPEIDSDSPAGSDQDDDMVFESAPVQSLATASVDEVSQLSPDEIAASRPSKPKAKVSLSSLKTAADLLKGDASPLMAYREGTMVRHEQHGEGTIIEVTGRGPKRTAKVQFDAGEFSFRLAYAKLEVV